MKILKKILKIKKIFKRPDKKKFLIIDAYNSFIFEKYIKKDDMGILHTRYESLNFYVIVKNILKLKLNFFDYIVEYIRLTNCEFIISFFDNNLSYYKLKKYFPNKTIIIIQNGTRSEFFFNQLSKKNLKVDYLLTFSDFYSKKFREHVDAKCITIGSFKNNQITKQKNHHKDKSIAYISDYVLPIFPENPSLAYVNVGANKKVKINDYYSPEKKLLPILLNFCKENKFKFKIIGRAKFKKTFFFEKEFYEKFLSPNDFELLDTFKFDNCYRFSDSFNLTINIQSAFGLESIARGNRTVIFNVRDKATNIKSLRLFPSDEGISSKGLFWSDEINEEEVNRTLSYSLKSSDHEWEKSIKQIIPQIISYDFDNSKFKKLLNE